jgi:transposase-like protein
MEPALREFLGDGATLSPSTITNLKKKWEEEFSAWKKEKITEEFAYIWVDGVNLRIRLGEDNKICLLVVIGVNAKGEKKLLAAEAGYRESKDSWAAVLRDLRDRGFKAPLVAVGDGALGFWGALRAVDGFAKTKEQRCWVHKIANVLDKLPKRLQPRAKGMLHEMMRAESRAAAGKIKIKFAEEFHAKYASAVDCLEKDWAELTVYFDFPAEHWKHLRTTNPIESTFATVRLRTTITKGAGSATAAKTMAFKLLQEAEKRWNKINGVKQIENILQGIAYKDGVMVPTKSSQETPAA